jgi:hypothetical protein
LSNSVDFTVTSSDIGTASIDQNSLTQAIGVPRITGKAKGIPKIKLGFAMMFQYGLSTVYWLDSPIPVVNGCWSVSLGRQRSWGDSNPLPLEPGAYSIQLFDADSLRRLGNGQLTISTH